MKTLYINTATKQAHVAVFQEDILLIEKTWESYKKEAETLQQEIAQLFLKNSLEPKDIHRIMSVIGPGPFTSTRIGISACNAWSFALSIPLAAVTIFDLYPSQKNLFILATNEQEAWVKKPNENGIYLTQGDFKEYHFSYSGILNSSWSNFLRSQEGGVLDQKEKIPKPSKMKFEYTLLQPWYYKEPHITWSKKISSL